MNNKRIADESLIAYCGLYCGECKVYLKGKCKGCKENIKADKWCKVKKCCEDNSYKNCADCKTYNNSTDCKMLNNFIAKIFSLMFGSNRNACIKKIKEIGNQAYAKEMTVKKSMTIK
ncbi:DUF3795 domain-containing protein [Petroclostridium sp. X23]|uniref:DUF3795 domain-containing protein n=1 Tax=Petroclostridium sp. X23 TaxID=3045146 RepID=UPI0024ADED9F|nr:DUF3795 domain-containing protein [Petroclostridium sp. X23]WHH60803.1 DUF3795 domain-containing protein [Petroclostridium sp. X23]